MGVGEQLANCRPFRLIESTNYLTTLFFIGRFPLI